MTTKILKSSQEQASSAWIEYLRILREEALIDKLSAQDVNLEKALKTLNEIIKEYEPTSEFDEEMFEQIIESIIVDDTSSMTFHLIGGLTLTEEIKEKGRCKTA